MRLSESDIRALLGGSSFGIELEIANSDRTVELPEGNTWCRKDGSVINKNRVGNDPFGEYNLRGGEIQVKPQPDEDSLLDYVLMILNLTHCEEIMDPNTFHVHIRIPELLRDENVEILRHCINWSNRWNPLLLPMVSDLPSMAYIKRQQYHSPDQRKMFMRGYRDKHRSRHSVLPAGSMARVNDPEVKTVDDLINAMPPRRKNGQLSWNILPRTGVNYRKMLSTDIGTVEFRCFSGSSDPALIRNIVDFPRAYFQSALRDEDPRPRFEGLSYPGYYGWTAEPEEHSLRWLKTDHDKLKRKEIISNLEEMLLSREVLLGGLGYPEDFWRRRLGDVVYNDLERFSREEHPVRDAEYTEMMRARTKVARVEETPDVIDIFGGGC